MSLLSCSRWVSSLRRCHPRCPTVSGAAVLVAVSSLRCPLCLFLSALSSLPSYRVLTTLSSHTALSSPRCPRRRCPRCGVLAAVSTLQYPRFGNLVAMSSLPCHPSLVLAAVSFLRCPRCRVHAAVSSLLCPRCRVLDAVSSLPCPRCCILMATSSLPCPSSPCPFCGVLAAVSSLLSSRCFRLAAEVTGHYECGQCSVTWCVFNTSFVFAQLRIGVAQIISFGVQRVGISNFIFQPSYMYQPRS